MHRAPLRFHKNKVEILEQKTSQDYALAEVIDGNTVVTHGTSVKWSFHTFQFSTDRHIYTLLLNSLTPSLRITFFGTSLPQFHATRLGCHYSYLQSVENTPWLNALRVTPRELIGLGLFERYNNFNSRTSIVATLKAKYCLLMDPPSPYLTDHVSRLCWAYFGLCDGVTKDDVV
jgi:hypothetical protein